MTDQQTSRTNITEALGARTDDAAIRASAEAEYAVLAMLDQPLMPVEEDGYHDHTGIPCRTCVALTLPRSGTWAEPLDLLRDIVQHWDAGDIDRDYDSLSSAIDSAREYIRANGHLSGEHRHPRSDAVTAPDEPSTPTTAEEWAALPDFDMWELAGIVRHQMKVRGYADSVLWGVTCDFGDPPCDRSAGHTGPHRAASASVPPLDELTQRFGDEMHLYFGELFSPDEHAAAKGIFRNTVAAAYAAEAPEQGRGDE